MQVNIPYIDPMGFMGFQGKDFVCGRSHCFFLPTASEATHIVVGNGSFGFGMNGKDVFSKGWKRIRHGESRWPSPLPNPVAIWIRGQWLTKTCMGVALRHRSLPSGYGSTNSLVFFDVCQGLNSHCFHIIGDGHQPKSVGVYIPIIRIPIKGGMSLSPIKRDKCTCRCILFNIQPWHSFWTNYNDLSRGHFKMVVIVRESHQIVLNLALGLILILTCPDSYFQSLFFFFFWGGEGYEPSGSLKWEWFTFHFIQTYGFALGQPIF